MVYISKVYTRSGDDGGTMLASGDRIGKDHPRIRSYGDLDELNCAIGFLRAEIGRVQAGFAALNFLSEVEVELRRVQQELFNVGAELATPGIELTEHAIAQRHVDALEQAMDRYNEALEPLTSFVLPGGGPVGAACHLARTVCRRAERELVALAHTDAVRPEVLKYVNRLSDYFFVLARATAKRLGIAETLWDPKTV
ncbi:MAG TPA: cob(I)yrinic acid a,c-diamide adenosyltransferase [Nannocystaceae bacterium]|nr:cob(I)yrinic acid a,c-diamide adenosyltransferase [Nannocystaceae bacterium]